MQYVMTVIWTLILVTMLNYVVGSVNGVEEFNFFHGLYMAIPAAIIIILITKVIPDEPVEAKHH
ncbi:MULTISPECIES: DUF2929 family protein [unclassified Psychrobacillus]|uniref:DUF2929 family protein n=1 Tax=unclassified Psychrobacillus TaxID=2636677 RepID=UPI00146F8FDF|nr:MULTISPECIES: DUF2929 family protein [unclassified Psychrobacillus]MCM3358921.1 YjzD family protein [Psychrobacillus sp. MER TA 171]NME07509.1 DUF2929 family protein [Psychrobacillus sp. BL-248-WT-3]